MKEIKIEHLSYLLKQARDKNKPQPIFFLGAGASRSGKIPLAGEIIKKILEDYPDSPFIKDLPIDQRTYAKLMGCLLPDQRDELLKKYIDEAKINVTHIYLAQLMREGYVDYVLTVNFDNLMLRALALYNIFPATYDLAILKDFTTSTFKEKSVVYLHGQHHGLWLLNTPEEMEKVRNTVPRTFDTIKNLRPWVFIGYSGEDPIFEHVKNLGRFDNGLYWVTYNDINPNENIQHFLSDPNTNAFVIKGYDSDSFMLKLNSVLGLEQPVIIDKPFTALKNMLNEIVDIDEKDHFRGVKERLRISKNQLGEAIKEFEKGESKTRDISENKIDVLKKEMINLIISEQYDDKVILEIENKIKNNPDNEAKSILAGLYSNWGTDLGKLAKTKLGKEAENLYQQAFDKYRKAIEIKFDNHEGYNNWGTHLGNLAQTKEGKEANDLYEQSFAKYRKALEIKPDHYQTYNNWGIYLGNLAQTKEGKVAEDLYQQSFNKYHKALEIKPDDYEAYNNWGIYLGNLAQTKEGEEAEELYQQAFDKLQKALEIQPDNPEVYSNWGAHLGNLAKTRVGQEAEDLYQQAFDKYSQALQRNPDNYQVYDRWGAHLGNLAQTKEGLQAEDLYQQSFDKYRKALEIKQDNHETYNRWGIQLGMLADSKQGKEADDLYRQSFDKFRKAIEINPDNYDAYNNWGIYLGNLAKTKKGQEAENVYQQAFDKTQKALEIKPDKYEAYFNCGNLLGNMAQTKQGREADNLNQQAFEKYSKAIEIKPNNHKIYNNWGVCLMNLAQTKEGKEAEDLYQQSFDKYLKAIELGGDCYNLACLFALKKNEEKALYYLDVSLSKKEITINFVEADSDWKDFLFNEKFIELLKKYK